jgi:alpha-N-arabinofuranosidase
MKDQIDEHARAGGGVQLAFTEWLFHGQAHRVPRFDNMGGALCTAGFLNTLMRVAEFTPIANMTGLVEFGGITKRRATVFGVPAYWAFRMYSNTDIRTPVETRAEVETYDVQQGNSRIPEISGVPYLDVVSALDEAGDTLTVFCVNRKTDAGIRSRLEISNFPIARAEGSELRAGSVFARNDEWRPDAIRPTTVELEVSGTALEYEFPPASVTVLIFARR